MPFYEPAHLSVANNLSSSLLWKAHERFGDYADQLLDNAQQSVRLLCEPTGLTLDGWVQDAGRSVVASAQDGNLRLEHGTCRTQHLYAAHAKQMYLNLTLRCTQNILNLMNATILIC